jgi:hypothetical protein
MEVSPSMTSPSPAKRFNWSNLRIRVASATVLVPTVVAAVWFGDVWYLGLILVGVALLAREWAEMSARRAVLGVALAIGAAVAISVIVAFRGHYYITWPVVIVGALAAALMARGAVERRADAAYGVIYIAPAVIAMIWLRRMEAGLSWTLLMFTVTWFADIFAFATGSLLKGPKLWPRYSPNKTWSGFFGGWSPPRWARSASWPCPGAARLAGPASGLAGRRRDRPAGRPGHHGRRPVGIDAQASVRREGLGRPDPRPWRHAGPRRRPDVRGDRGRRRAAARPVGMAALTQTRPGVPRKVVVLGSTGSIGVSTLDLFEQADVAVEILALTAGRNVAKLAEQALRWKPQVAVIDDETCLPELRERLAGSGVRAAAGAAAVSEAAAMGADWVMSAIVGRRAWPRPWPPPAPARSSPWPTRKAWSAPARPCWPSPARPAAR